jgi:phage repressor protein C with HTH and peptisase S24 domain
MAMEKQRFGDQVVAAAKARGWNMKQLAREAGVSYDVVRELHRRPHGTTGAENARKLAAVLQIGLSNAARMPELAGADLVPVYAVHASAGPGALVAGHEEIVDQLAFPPGYLRSITKANSRDLAIIGVKGDSMAPTLADNDVVMVDLSKRDLSFDGLFVLRDGGASLLVKRIGRASGRGKVLVISDNRTYPPMERSIEDIEVVGKVVWRGVKE